MATAVKERKRSSILGRFSLFSKTPSVWEVTSDDDLGLDPKSNKAKHSSSNSDPRRHADRRRTIGATEQLVVDRPGSQFSIRSNGSAYSVSTTRSHGSAYSNGSDRPRPRTLEGALPPLSPLALPSVSSATSISSSERSGSKRSSHIQLVPKSMLSADSLPASLDEVRRMEREMQAIVSRDRRSRGQSSNSVDLDRPRSDASSSTTGSKVRIQYVPRSSLTQPQDLSSSIPITPLAKPTPPIQTRISRSLTAVTEETRMNSDYHSDIEEEEEAGEDDGSAEKKSSD